MIELAVTRTAVVVRKVSVVTRFAAIEKAIAAFGDLAVEGVRSFVVGSRVERAVEILAVDCAVAIFVTTAGASLDGPDDRIFMPLDVRPGRGG
jgi:hypothetical protein